MGLLLNDKNKFGFVHIPKTGGRTITKILMDVDGTQELTSHHGLSLLPDNNDYTYFTIVRNPFTRIASAYYHECRKFGFKEFHKFLNEINETNPWYIPQVYYINSGKTNRRYIKHILKYENYDKEVKQLLRKLNIQNIKKLPHLNKNPIYEKHPNLKQEKYYRFLYTEEWMKELVRERYKDDFKIFNYGMDI